MPFTFFHLGPSLAVGLPMRKYLHVPTFIVGNVILDIEGLLVMVLGLNYPLHGYLHTLLFASIVGAILGFVMFKVEKPMQPLYRKIQLETNSCMGVKSFLFAGIFGTVLHVLFDTLLYREMMPFFPLTINPFVDFGLSMSLVYDVCVWLGIFGIGYYVVLFAYSIYKKPRKK
jgi:hypothetical protein